MGSERYNENIKLHDNKISKFSMQNGQCEISKVFLKEGTREIHHKNPKALGGSDSFTNIISWLNSKVHKLIHVTDQQLIEKYFNEVKAMSKEKEDKLIKRINKYREKAKLKPISLLNV
ncbi:HNH endonuclease signature motif containing protein [Clostridium pasteurianum]|uniref:HNH endonuclease signature motif containing protein n=1 Tax=Clostridium pasteurianum TaxID=1501 RepID=UPI002260C656|nr:HNH endonuclease signature motif containing protein [Clostridium pasteurianum]UZW14746.1 HNH endonuclease signature motif containing protein [Clostridium pasteurianum]